MLAGPPALGYDHHVRAIARLDDIPAEGLRFSYREGPFETEGILVRLADGQVRAYKNECRHLPMPLDDREPRKLWDASGTHLECSAHGARYRPQDGLCVSGPCAGSHLRELKLSVDGDQVLLDESSTSSFFDV